MLRQNVICNQEKIEITGQELKYIKAELSEKKQGEKLQLWLPESLKIEGPFISKPQITRFSIYVALFSFYS